MVKTRKYWSVFLLLAIGCGSTESVDLDEPPQTEMDLGSDTPPDAEVPGLDSGTGCELELAQCASEFQCVWNGEKCTKPAAYGLTNSPTQLSQMPGELIVAGAAETATLSLYQTLDGDLRGSLNGSLGTALIEGKVHEDLGVMELNFFLGRCEGACEPEFSAQGHYDSKQWIFSHAQSNTELGLNLFDNFRFEPNDGIKPSRVPGQEFHGYLTSIFSGAPMAPSQRCVLMLPKFAENELSVPSLTCGEEERPTVSMRSGTLVIKEWAVSFEIEAAEESFYFTGLLGHEVGGVITATKPAHMDMDRVPTADIVGFAVFQ